MTPGPSVGTSGTQYETLRASSYDTLASPAECSRCKHLPTQGTSALAVKSDQETHTTRLSLGKYFIRVDVFFFNFKDFSLYFILFKKLYFIFFIYGLKFSFHIYGFKFSFSYLWFEIQVFLFVV
jgi:hypothetical protein